MKRLRQLIIGLAVICPCAGQVVADAQQIGSPAGIKAEQALPSRYPFVVADMLKFCRPTKGFWIDLGAGKGQVAIPLTETTGVPVTMVDPNADALGEALRLARQKGLADRLFAVVGVAERLPFPDDSVDLLVSRGAIFFFQDPVKGLQEVYRVLRPGGKAYIGGGAGSGYPRAAVAKLIAGRKRNLQGDGAEKWREFVALRRPEKMRQWATAAGLPAFTVMGQGAISADDQRVGQGVWLLFEKRATATGAKSTD